MACSTSSPAPVMESQAVMAIHITFIHTTFIHITFLYITFVNIHYFYTQYFYNNGCLVMKLYTSVLILSSVSRLRLHTCAYSDVTVVQVDTQIMCPVDDSRKLLT